MAIAKLKCACSEEQFRDGQVEGYWVGLLGGGSGALISLLGMHSAPLVALEIIGGLGAVVLSLLGYKPFVRYGIPFGGAFAVGAGLGYAGTSAEFAKAREEVIQSVAAVLNSPAFSDFAHNSAFEAQLHPDKMGFQ